jgi:hypothetical protein
MDNEASRSGSLLLMLVAVACGGPDGGRFSPEVADSAGIRIITTTTPELEHWQVDPVPFLDIGTAEGEDGQDLALPWASRRLPDGRVAISNARTNELRFYAPGGSYLGATGGSGEGPGEFDLIAALHIGVADTIIVADATLPRLSLFAPDGDFARTAPVDPVEGRLPRLRGLVAGTLAVYRVPFYERSGGISRAVRDTSLIIARPLDGGDIVTIGRFPATEHFNQVLPSGGIAAWNLPFTRGFFDAFGGGLYWIGVSDRYELSGFDPASGELRRIIRVHHWPLTVTNDDHQEFFAYQLADIDDPDQERTYRQVHEIIEFPPTFPAFADMTEDSDGNIWVRDFAVPWDDGPQAWSVFTADGESITRVRIPDGLDIQDIGADYVMGLWRDDLEVEHIRAHRLTRTPN